MISEEVFEYRKGLFIFAAYERGLYGSSLFCLTEPSEKLGCNRETLRRWVRQDQQDGGWREGLTTDERKRLKTLEKENRELRRANEILKTASAFFVPKRSSTAN